MNRVVSWLHVETRFSARPPGFPPRFLCLSTLSATAGRGSQTPRHYAVGPQAGLGAAADRVADSA